MRGIPRIILVLSLTFACNESNKRQVRSNPLVLISEYALQIPEPSGMCDFIDGTFLSVSDSDGMIYQIDSFGRTLDVIDIHGRSLEGITFDFSDSTIYSVDERTGRISAFDLKGELLNSWQIDSGGDNSGLEGCSIDRENRIIYILKEKSKGLLYTFDMDKGKSSSIQLGFAKDYSGVFYDDLDQSLWIVSDKSKSVNQCDINGKLMKSYSINVVKAEGIVVNSELDRIFVISDSQERLFVFAKP